VIRDPEFLRECRAIARAVERFPTIAALRSSAEWSDLERRLRCLLGRVHRHEPASPPPPSAQPDRVKVVHWNIEHGNWYEQVERALREHPELRDADLYLFNEIDLGMARAGNRDVTGDLARALGLHGAWVPLFLETTVGRDDDAHTAAGLANEESLFGLGMLSRWPIGKIRVLELPSPEAYQFDLERMVGRHVALIAEILRPEGAFVAVSSHLEVHRTRAHRAAQMRAIVEALADERRPVILGGDFNTHTFERGRPQDVIMGAWALMFAPTRALVHRLLFPDRGRNREPLFDELKRAGFEWNRYGDHVPTLQLRFDRIDELRTFPHFVQRAASAVLHWAERRGQLRLDWFAGRGWSAGRGFTVEGLNGPGRASDHAPIVAELW
jgi:endonuclease/exonuclease/phosphatase family metal-dependent hydrolase